MSILITTGIYPPDIGGPATYSKLLFDELPKRGVGVNVLSFGEVRNLPKIIRHIAFFFKIIFKSETFDTIFAQDTVSVGLPSLCAAKILGKRFFVRVPGDYAWEQASQRYGVKESIDDFQHKKYSSKIEILRNVQRFVVNNADKVITPSLYFKKLVSEWVDNTDKVQCIYNGIDLTDIPESTNSYEQKTIITAGRLVPWKGFGPLILAMKSLPDWKLFIAGDGPMRKELEDLILGNYLQSRVFLLGQVDRKELIKKIQESDVFVLNTHFESFSFQVVEAMACGIPVITTNVGNLGEIIDNEQNGVLVTPDDTEAIVKWCLTLSSDKVKRESFIKSAKEKVQQFSINNTVDKVVNMLV